MSLDAALTFSQRIRNSVWKAMNAQEDPIIQRMDNENLEGLFRLQNRVEKILGHDIDGNVLVALAIKRFVDCYLDEPEELVNVFKYYGLENGDDDERLEKKE